MCDEQAPIVSELIRVLYGIWNRTDSVIAVQRANVDCVSGGHLPSVPVAEITALARQACDLHFSCMNL